MKEEQIPFSDDGEIVVTDDQRVEAWRAHPHYRKSCAECQHVSILHIDGEGACSANLGPGEPCACKRFVLATPKGRA